MVSQAKGGSPKSTLIFNKECHFTKLKTKLVLFSKIISKNTTLITTFESLQNRADKRATENKLESENEIEYAKRNLKIIKKV